MGSWYKTDFKGVRYRKHATRKHGVQSDKYYVLTYKLDGRTKSEAVGWATEGVKPSECFEILCQLKQNRVTGKGPRTLAEMREAEDMKRLEKEKQARKEAKRNISFKQFFEESYQPDAELAKKPESFRKELEHLNNWIHPVTGDLPMSELNIEHVKKIRSNLAKKNRSPRTQQYVFRTFTTVWNAALDSGIVSAPSPTKNRSFKLPKVSNKRERYLTHEETEKLLEKVKEKSQQVYDMTFLALFTGMRFSEVASLKWGNVDLENASIRIKAKHEKIRTIPMTEEAVNLFSGMKVGKPSELIFPNRKGEKHSQVPSTFKRAVEDSGLNEGVERRQRVGFHTLRHTKASWLIRAGVDLYRVQKILGHGTPIQTQRYSHLTDSDLRKATKREEAYRKAKLGTVVPFPKTKLENKG